MILQNVLIFFVFFYGALLGSFCNVLIIRIPQNMNWISARSKCLSCGKKLSWWMNIPLLSFIFLKRKCFFCNAKISWQYFIIELFSAIKALFIFYSFDYQLNSQTLIPFILNDLIVVILLVHFLIDLKHKILPDILTLGLLLIGVIEMCIRGVWQEPLLGALIGFFAPLLITYLFYKIRGLIGMGGGDIKLYGVIGLFVGPFGIVQTMMVSSILGIIMALFFSIYKKMKLDQHFAFGPAIIITFLIQRFFPDILPSILSQGHYR